MYRNEFLKRIDHQTLNMLLEYHYNKLMDKIITLEQRALYNELYEVLTIEKTARGYEEEKN